MKLLVAKEVAKILQCSVSTVYEWANHGKIPVYRINGLLRFEEREVFEWIKTSRLESKREALRPSKRPYMRNEEIEGIISRAIDSVKKGGYNPPKGEIRPNQARKGGRNGFIQKGQGLVDEFHL